MGTWDRLVFGESDPHPSKRAAQIVIFTLFFVCWFGLRIEFAISAWWLKWGSIVAVVAGALLSPWFCRLCWDGFGAGGRSRTVVIPFYVSAFVALFIVSWTMIVVVAPGLSTRWTFAETSAQAELRKERHSGRYECDYQVHGEHFRFQPAGYICITSQEFNNLPDNGPMLVREKRSIFGIYIEGVEPASADKR